MCLCTIALLGAVGPVAQEGELVVRVAWRLGDRGHRLGKRYQEVAPAVAREERRLLQSQGERWEQQEAPHVANGLGARRRPRQQLSRVRGERAASRHRDAREDVVPARAPEPRARLDEHFDVAVRPLAAVREPSSGARRWR